MSRAPSALAAAAVLMAASATAARLPVPAALDPPAGEVLLLELAAKGVQIYECRAKAGATSAQEWAFVAPEAELFDASGRRVATHGAGPSKTVAPPGARHDLVLDAGDHGRPRPRESPHHHRRGANGSGQHDDVVTGRTGIVSPGSASSLMNALNRAASASS